ncbi:SMODS domain-containing nucleotidyltransferase [Limosilactobacillus fastidiosus]|uniref:Nucleotidyltransferase n=1 Tax=Limosilactobacillus fastidiosus TaxID=2759855 RepID=A0A7W3TYY2_9LACO|nr:nucleotidyltransferase [Limosilactobacillus fastidiosus]MBB1085884.1 nucleotidyltransferase [Limosilactobacillus fastidiosus]MCD7085779.1 nucleotidyltransferase [Limosilactobacillus fastidiosus]MCD7113856.1 nucleotidyltransferase [Limosilactobacillus fastidiosus]MCD7115688.1 nucleotidyltransferase [Limosilactobacillus fastidiosus]
MTISSVFSNFCSSIKLTEDDHWLSRLRAITKKINGKYYSNENDDTSHRLLVGSIGRKTATNDASDYDILFSLPWDVYHRFDHYGNNSQKYLLQEVRNCIRERYPKTDIRGDGQVVDINFSDGLIEVVPGFESEDGSFKYPDSNDGGKWKITNPRPEKLCCDDDNQSSNGTFRDITRMIRVWKNHKGFVLKGLLIDTFIDEFYQENKEFVNDNSYSKYPLIMKKAFHKLSQKDSDQHYWHALGSNQIINNNDDSRFIEQAKKAFNKLDSIDLENKDEVLNAFSKLFGQRFSKLVNDSRNNSKEQFASDYFSGINIKGTFNIKCTVEQKGFQPHSFSYYLNNFHFILKHRRLKFQITDLDIPNLDTIKPAFYWKIRNYGAEAEARNQLRGEIFRGEKIHEESTLYRSMRHYVECYVVVNNIVIAKNRIIVPIGDNSNEK